MSLIVACSKCSKKYKVGDDKAGKKIKCTGCGAIIPIPAPAAPPDGDVDLWNLPPAEDTRGLPPLEIPGRTSSRKTPSKKARSSKEGMPTWLKVLLIVCSALGGVSLLACGGCYLLVKRTGEVLQNAADQAKSDLEKDLKNAEEKANANVNRGSLADARKGFQTKLTRRDVSKAAILEPPADVFRKIVYDAPSGKLGAYISPDPKDGKKHPAIVWITGGDCNTIGDVWTAADPGNDQTAAAYRKAGIIMMFPSLRGGDGNPGVKEGFLGEVDDVLAAANMLATESYVDPSRVYLGGHSTGGTMVLLVAEMGTDKFRSIFSFGPADVISGYGPERCPFDLTNTKEVELRSPLHWLASIKAPTFVFEGNEQGNIPSLQAMDMASKNPKARFFPVAGVSHFSILAPTNSLIAQKILNDTGPTCNISFTPDELRQAAGK